MESNNRTISRTLTSYTLNNGNEIDCIESKYVAAIFNVEEKELERIVSKTRTYCKANANMTVYNNHFFFDENNKIEAISVLGLAFICTFMTDLHHSLKSYKNYFNQLSMNWIYKVDFYKKHSTTIRNSHAARSTNIDFETAAEYQVTKEIQADYKVLKTDVEDVNHIFYKKKVVITGEFDAFEIRNEMAELLHNVGAKNQSGVNSATDYVILGKNAGPKKLEKIAELNVKTIDEKEFCQIFNI